MKALLIEDRIDMAQKIKTALESRGHEVTWITGAQSLGQGTARGFTADKAGADVTFAGYQIAFVDGCLEGRLCGWEITPYLVQAGVLCVGISGGGDFNPELRRAGAKLASAKEHVVRDLDKLLADAAALLAGG